MIFPLGDAVRRGKTLERKMCGVYISEELMEHSSRNSVCFSRDEDAIDSPCRARDHRWKVRRGSEGANWAQESSRGLHQWETPVASSGSLRPHDPWGRVWR